jgi:hypothetical protein
VKPASPNRLKVDFFANGFYCNVAVDGAYAEYFMIDPKTLADRFPGDFIFGVATASFQIEGATKPTAASRRSGMRFPTCRAGSIRAIMAISPAIIMTGWMKTSI